MAARETLILRNMRLVAHVVKKYQCPEYEQEELISIGTIGLIKAVGTYRRDKNIKLATYASRCIENEILMHIRKISNQKTEVSLDEPINMDCDGNELLLSDVLAEDADSVNCNIEYEDEKRLLHSVVDRLNDREKMIINMRFGIDGQQEHTQKEVADLLGISQSYISRLEKRIISRIRKEMEEAGINSEIVSPKLLPDYTRKVNG